MLSFSFSLVHEALVDVDALVDQTVGLVLNGLLLVTSQTLEVSNVQVSFSFRLLGTGLPHVGSEHLTARGEDEMCASVMGLQLEATLCVDSAVNVLADNVLIVSERLIDLVKDALANFEHIYNVVDSINTLDDKRSNIVCLATGRWVESRLV